MIELIEKGEEYFCEHLGLEYTGQLEFKKNGWTIEYLGTDDKPYRWRIDNFDIETTVEQIIFLDIENKTFFELLLKSIGIL